MPNRIIKESICTSDNLNLLKPESEVLFYRLLVCCDDYGLMDARPKVVRSKCYPLKTDAITCEQIITWLADLAANELVDIYLVDNHPYLAIRRWKDHQRPRALKPKYPLPDKGNLLSIDNICKHLTALDADNRYSLIVNRESLIVNRSADERPGKEMETKPTAPFLQTPPRERPKSCHGFKTIGDVIRENADLFDGKGPGTGVHIAP